MKTKILVTFFILLAGSAQIIAAQDAQSKNVPEKKDAQNKDAGKKDAPAPSQDAAKTPGRKGGGA